MSDDKKYIDSVTYYLGGREWDAVTHYGSSIDMYAWERGKTVYSNRSINWTGYVGLMYPSDYAYTFANGVNGTDTTCFDDPRYCGEHNPSASWLYKKISMDYIT